VKRFLVLFENLVDPKLMNHVSLIATDLPTSLAVS